MRRPYQAVRGAPPELRLQLKRSVFIDNNQIGVPGGRRAERLIAETQTIGKEMKGSVLPMFEVASGQRGTRAAAEVDKIKSEEQVIGVHRRRQAPGYDEATASGRLHEPGGTAGLAGVLRSCPQDDRPVRSTAFRRFKTA